MYHYPTAKGTASPVQPSDGMILAGAPRLEGHSVIFLILVSVAVPYFKFFRRDSDL